MLSAKDTWPELTEAEALARVKKEPEVKWPRWANPWGKNIGGYLIRFDVPDHLGTFVYFDGRTRECTCDGNSTTHFNDFPSTEITAERAAEILAANKPKAKRVVPFTAETFPKGMVWVRPIGATGWRTLVWQVTSECVQANLHISYADLSHYNEYSTDGGLTWGVCGTEVEA